MKAFYLKFLLISVLLLGGFEAFSQQKYKTEANADFVEYTNREGLPSSNLANIVQTKDGYIWLSGIEGTFRFNGYDFDEVGKEIGLPKMQGMYHDTVTNVLWFASPEKVISFDGTVFKSYTNEDGYRINGLPGQIISFIDADSKGRIWIGSHTPYVDKNFNGGLTKLEGGKFTVYSNPEFPLDNATGFFEAPNGDLIFTSAGHNTQTKEDSYVALFKDGKFTKIDESVGVKFQNANVFSPSATSAVDENGNLWIAFSGIIKYTTGDKNSSGVLMYDGTRFHSFTDFNKDLDKNHSPFQVYYSKAQKKLFMTTTTMVPSVLDFFSPNGKSVFEFTGGRWVVSDVMKKIREITDLKSGKILHDFNFARVMFTNANSIFPELINFKVSYDYQLAKYPEQKFSFENGNWKKVDALTALPRAEIKDGLILTTTKGFGFYYPNRSQLLKPKDGLLQLQGGIPAFQTDRNGIVWISYSYTNLPAYSETHATGINYWDGTTLKGFTEKDGLHSNITFDTYADTRSRVWIPTSKGVNLVTETRDSTGEFKMSLSKIQSDRSESYNTSTIFETRNGDIFAWQNYVRPESNNLEKSDFYLGKFNGEKFIEMKSPFSADENRKKLQLIDVQEDNQARVWLLGIFSDSLKEMTSSPTKIRFYENNTWNPAPASWKVPNEQFKYVGRLKSGLYFLATGGFYQFNGTSFINLIDSVNANADFRLLKGASVAGTRTDISANEKLYIRLRNRGLFIFDGTSLRFYTKKDGLPSASLSNPVVDLRGNVTFNFPSGSLVVNNDRFQTFYEDENLVSGGPDGSILDGDGNMVQMYNGAGLYINKVETQIFPLKIASVSADTQSFFYDFPKSIPFLENSLVFTYAALNYKNPRQTFYQHFLEGYDKTWSRTSSVPFVEYQNLPPGKYKFRVKAVTSNGLETNEDVYTFRIEPPWYRTSVAYIFYFMVLVFSIYGYDRFQRNRLLAKSQAEMAIKEAELRAMAAESQAKIIQAENDRKTKELEEARQLQLSMLPKFIPQIANYDIAVFMKTSTEVGGDYYDFNVSSDGTLTIVIGDATGHGLRAGTLVTAAKSLFNILGSHQDIVYSLQEFSRCILALDFQRLSMCMTFLKIRNNQFKVGSAGMPPLFIYRAATQTVDEFVIEGAPLGTFIGFPYQIKSQELNPGDVILLMTDGFPELISKTGEVFNYSRVSELFRKHAALSSEKIIEEFEKTANEWLQGKEADDDLTFVVLKVR